MTTHGPRSRTADTRQIPHWPWHSSSNLEWRDFSGEWGPALQNHGPRSTSKTSVSPELIGYWPTKAHWFARDCFVPCSGESEASMRLQFCPCEYRGIWMRVYVPCPQKW